MSQQIPASMLLDPATLEDPYPFYRSLQQQAPVWKVPDTQIYLVTSYALLDEAARRVEDFSSNLNGVLYRKWGGLPGRVTRRGLPQILATADPPDHKRHKTAVAGNFTPRRIAALEQEVERLAVSLISPAVAGGKCEFMSEVANPLPMQVVSDLVGFTGADLTRLMQAAFDSTAVVSGSSSLLQLGWCMWRSLMIQKWIARQLKSVRPEDGNILAGIKRGIDDGTLQYIEGMMFLHLFLAAGGESTTSLLGSAVRMLADDEELQETLRKQPGLIPDFAEEALRLESPFRFHLRCTPADTALGGVEIPAGSSVLMFWGAGNRDPEAFDRPDEIDLQRPRRHMAFGKGIHTCIGAPLARLEVQIVLRVLLESTAHFRLEPGHSPEWVRSLQVRRYKRLPILLRR